MEKTAQEWFEEGVKLYELEKYEGAIDAFTRSLNLLDDNYNDKSIIYNYLGIAKSFLGHKEAALSDYNIAIEIDNKYVDAYFNRALNKTDLGDLQGALLDYRKVIELNPENKDAYSNYAVIKNTLGDNEDAINYCNKAIELDNQNYIYYYNRGVVKQGLKDYMGAIEDYDISININDSFEKTYTNRAVSKTSIGDLDGAILDYNIAIKLNSNERAALNNLGFIYKSKGDNILALEYFEKAIISDMEYPMGYHNRAVVKYEMGDIEGAFKDLNLALSLSPEDQSIKYTLSVIKVEQGITIGLEEQKYLESIEPIYELIKDWGNIKSGNILTKINNIINVSINEIKKIAKVDVSIKELVHYTKVDVAEIFVDKDNANYRFYNSAYMNDPEEGDVILNFLVNDKIKNAFIKGKQGEESNFYIGSFLPANLNDPKESHDDDLVMWRTYGKDKNNNEACGCSIVIGADFFDFSVEDKRMLMATDRKIEDRDKLLKVIYYDRRKGKFENNDEELKKIFKKLEGDLNKLLKDYKEHEITINKIIYHLLSEIRFLFKSADYYYENELRVIEFARYYDKEKVKFDENNRLYIESKLPVQKYIKRIVLGPKVANPENHLYLAAKMAQNGNPIQLYKSTCNFK